MLAAMAGETPPTRVTTVGHGTLEIDDFLELLDGAGIEKVVDIRAFPGSRRNPQYGQDALAAALRAHGIEYRWEPRLGGRRSDPKTSRHAALEHAAFRAYASHMETPEYAAALDELLAEAARAEIAIMCSESVWWRCHRRLVSDSIVVLHDGTVEHLFHDGRRQPHPVMPEARREDDVLVYDAGQPPLDA